MDSILTRPSRNPKEQKCTQSRRDAKNTQSFLAVYFRLEFYGKNHCVSRTSKFFGSKAEILIFFVSLSGISAPWRLCVIFFAKEYKSLPTIL